MRTFFQIVCLISSLGLLSCTSSGLYTPLPKNLEHQVSIKHYSNIRAWADAPSKAMDVSAQLSLKQMKKTYQGHLPSVINALAISGGGADGAFGAGILCGWSTTGKRPIFHIVTGISTGALMAPFAFLGSKYDKQLKTIYTKTSDQDIYEINNPVSLLIDYIKPTPYRAVASNKPIEALIKEVFDDAMLNAIAKEHLKGRRLFIGTSQMNAERLVIWDIGAIAISGQPDALKLIHKILLASSALPGIFPPQYIQVTANGKTYKEMHLDGGIETQVMLYEKALSPFATRYIGSEHQSLKKLYVIRNRKVDSEWEKVNPRLHHIVERAVSTLTKTQGVGDLYRLYAYAKRDKVDYNLVYIPKTFNFHARSLFDKKYMQQLFALGVAMGGGNPWTKHPPGLYD